MTTPDPGINIRGAVDLSALANPPAEQSAPTGDYIIEATAATFGAIVEQSQTVPVVVELYSPRSAASAQLSPILASITNRHAGKILLARVNADTEPDIAAAFGIQAVPATVAIVKTQPIPLFQGVPEENQISAVIDDVLRVAEEHGVTGSLATGDEAEAEPEPEPVPENIQAAYDAIEQGDFDAALAAYNAELAVNPADADAKAGVVTVGILSRVDGQDLASLIDAGNNAEPSALEAQLLAADAEMNLGDLGGAYSRLLASIRATAGDDRETVRQRLVELFLLAPEGSPELAQARKDLALALF